MGIKWNKKPSIDPIADKIDKTYRKFAINCYNNVKTLSPVDTGRYRHAHHISIGAPSYSETGGDVGLVLAIPKHTYPTIYIQNNVPYAAVLEYGGYPKPVKRGTPVKGRKIAGKQAYEVRSVGGFSYQAPTGVYGNAFNSALSKLS